MFNISLDVDYLNIYRRNEDLPLLEEEDIIIKKGLERACNLLSDFNFKATFFLVGDSVRRYKSYYLRLIRDGNEIGNHTMNHLNLLQLQPEDQAAQIFDCQRVIKEELDYHAIGFKAPAYNISDQIYQILLKCGIKYDTSCFHNILVPAAKILFYMRAGKNGFGRIGQMFQTGRIHKNGELFIVPVGSTLFKLPFYGSFHAMYPILANLRPPGFPFTYLIHPVEFLENHEINDLKTGFRTNLSERIKIYRRLFKRLKIANRRCLLLKDLIKELGCKQI